VHIQNARELVKLPDGHFLDEGRQNHRSGLEQIRTKIQTTRGLRAKAIEIVTPEPLSDDELQRIQSAIIRWAKTELHDARGELRAAMTLGWKSLRNGLFILGGALALSAWLQRMFGADVYFVTVIREGLTILGWISLWPGLEQLLHRPIAFLAERRRWKHIAALPTTKVPATFSPISH
jgi:hypothetical protein